MRVIYNYTLETNRPFRVNTVAVNLWLQLVLHVMLFHMLNVLHFTLVVSGVCVVCVCFCGVCVFLWCVCVCVCVVCVCVCVCVCVVPSMAVFFSSLILCSPQDVAQVFYADFKIVPGAPVNY